MSNGSAKVDMLSQAYAFRPACCQNLNHPKIGDFAMPRESSKQLDFLRFNQSVDESEHSNHITNSDVLPPLGGSSGGGELRAAGSLVHTLPTSDSGQTEKFYRKHASRFVNPQLARYKMILEKSDSLTAGKHLNRLADCRTRAFFTVHRESKKVRVASNRCNLRWCPMCQQTKRVIIAAGVSKWVESASAPKFLTLTLRSSDDPLSVQLRTLYDSFRKFRRRKFPKDLISGGFWFFQVTWNVSTMQWHPHIHCLIDSEFLPQRKLSKAWSNASGGSSIVDIRAVTDAVRSAQYVARYATAPASLLSFRPDQGHEIIDALSDQRIVGSWGSARGTALSPRKPEDAGSWLRAINYTSVVAGKSLHPVYQELYDCWRTGRPFELSIEVFGQGVEPDHEEMQFEPETHAQLEFDFRSPLNKSVFTECQKDGNAIA